jgi:hypothetical protein
MDEHSLSCIAAPSDAQALDVWEDRDGKMFRFFRDVPVSAKPDSAGRLRGPKKREINSIERLAEGSSWAGPGRGCHRRLNPGWGSRLPV